MNHRDIYKKSYDGTPIDLSSFPTVIQQEACPNVSSKYSFIPTTKAIDVFADYGFLPVQCKVSNSRLDKFNGFNRHEIRFRDPNISFANRCYAEIILKNAHNARGSFELWFGVHVKLCSNGLTLPKAYESYKIRHVGFTQDKVAEAIEGIVSQAPTVSNGIDKMLNTPMDQVSAFWFARKARELRHDMQDADIYLDPNELIKPIRYDGDHNNLWGVFNTVQERLLNGLYRYDRRNRKGKWCPLKAKKVKAIDTSRKLNQGLWELAETYISGTISIN